MLVKYLFVVFFVVFLVGCVSIEKVVLCFNMELVVEMWCVFYLFEIDSEVFCYVYVGELLGE